MNEEEKYIGKLLDDRYEIIETIGEGGMALVFRALDHRLNRNVAVKIMREEMARDEEFRRRFCAESHAVAMLSNPNIVAVYDVSHSDEREYIVMELISGITLKQYMDKKGALDWKEVVHFTKQITRALSHAHERGIIHRDIKPQNIMLLRDGTLKVADFGIAALENEVYENNGQTIGSIHYIAPEQARGNNPDARSDIYSLGVVMYEMLSGELPYTGNTLAEIAVKHMNARPAPLREKNPAIPEELERITLKAMNADLAQRYQTASELLADLDLFTQNTMKQDLPADNETEEAPKPVVSYSELTKASYNIRRKKASRVSFLSGSFALLLLALGIFVFLWNFWVKDLFSPAERLDLPNFVGSRYDDVVRDADSIFNFVITDVYTNDAEPGIIISQKPDPGRSMSIENDGVTVEISVSRSMTSIEVPDLSGYDYRTAAEQLQKMGFSVEIESATSDTVAHNYVISSSPAAGEMVISGSLIYLSVSSGPQVVYVEMPNLIGLSEEAAIKKLESNNLSYAGSEWIDSPLDRGTVVGQDVQIGESVEEHSKVTLQVSLGRE
ncbi:MAG: Stk1 family PASTA domain-containing Ser/Thr kinase [Oscillospiraceae bacterium]|nr:Stk1 family PASTA domain-containing Ser/Thr kinase [Oscillospiraceae bacterium]